MISFRRDMKTRAKAIENEVHQCGNENFKKGDFRKLDNLRELENDKQTAFMVGKRYYKLVTSHELFKDNTSCSVKAKCQNSIIMDR